MKRLVPLRLTMCAIAVGFAFASGVALADTAVGVTTDNNLVAFDTAAPGTILRTVAVSGLQTGESLVGIDFRPKDGRLYALGDTSRLYTIDLLTGAATPVGTSAFTPALSGTEFGFDFSPAADRIRVVSDAGQNLRLDPDTGLAVDSDPVAVGTQIDSNLAYAAADTNALATPNVVAVAYDRNIAGNPATTLFGIDSGLDILVRQGDVDGAPVSPDAGTLNTIGPLGVDTSGLTSLDITSTTVFATVTAPAATTSSLYIVDPTTGAATVVGTIGGGKAIRGTAIVPVRLYALTVDNELVTFSGPGIIPTPVPITGLQASENVVDIDVRPATGGLYGLGDSGRLYKIDVATAAATQVGTGTFAVALAGTDFGIDFNPVVDRLRVVSNTGQNLRVHPDTGQVVDGDTVAAGVQPDTALNFAVGDPNAAAIPNVVAIAYDSNLAGTPATTLFGIDAGLDILVRQGSVAGTPNSPNGGELTTIGPLGVNVAGGSTTFDIFSSVNLAFAVFPGAIPLTSDIYTIDLTTGTATLLGTVASGKVIRAVTAASTLPLAPPPVVDLYGLTDTNSLVALRSDAPGVLSTPIPITGLQTGEQIVAIDVRPATGVLYGISSQSRLYGINHTTGAAILVGTGPFAPALDGTEFGMDVNPTVDRIRVVSDADQNLRLDPTTGTIVDGDDVTAGTQTDTNLAFEVGDPNAATNPNVVALAYDRNTATATGTTLYGIDAGLDILVRQGSVDGTPNSPNTGLLSTIGALGVDTTGVAGFEIAADGSALAALAVAGGTSKLFRIDLTSGAATFIGELGAAQTIRGISIVPTADLPPPPPPPEPLTVNKLKITISFCGSGKDHIEIGGLLPAPTGSVDGMVVPVNIGGFAESFTLNSKGKGVNGDDKFQLIGKPKNGTVRFSVTIKKEDISDELADEGLTGGADLVKVDRQVQATVSFGAIVYQSLIDVLYSSKAEHNGVAKKKP